MNCVTEFIWSDLLHKTPCDTRMISLQNLELYYTLAKHFAVLILPLYHGQFQLAAGSNFIQRLT